MVSEIKIAFRLQLRIGSIRKMEKKDICHFFPVVLMLQNPGKD